MDHIIILRDGKEVSNDYYAMHVRLSKRLGVRVTEEGITRWTFSVDARADGVSAIVIRTSDPEADKAAKEFVGLSEETYVPSNGQRVRFAITCSGRVARPGERQTVLERMEFRNTRARINASKILGNYGSHIELVERLLGSAGLGDLEIETLNDHRFIVTKTKNHRGTGIGIVGIMAVGTATVDEIETLKTSLVKGLGRDKAFGFGTLVLSPEKARAVAA